MTNKAHYVSEGTIKKMLVWDTTNYKLAMDVKLPLFGAFAPVYKRQKQFIESVDKQMKSTKLYIFFKAGVRGLKPPAPFEIGNVVFVAVNFYNPKAFLPTKWVQDVLVIVDAQTVHYDKSRMNSGLLDALENTFGKQYKFVGTDQLEAGGNLQRVLTSKIETLITGRRNAAPSKIPSSGALQINLGSMALEAYNRQTFHLDCYFHWLGCCVHLSSKEPVAPAIHYYLRGIAYRESRYTGKPIRLLGLNIATYFAMLELDFRITDFVQEIKVPVLLIPHGRSGFKNQYYSLSYANCHVERIESADAQVKFKIYFPDFTAQLLNVTMQAHLKKRKEDLEEIASVLHATLVHFNPHSQLPLMPEETFIQKLLDDSPGTIDDFISKMQKKIEDAFKGYPVEVYFIKSRFRYLAQRFGSLHCMSIAMLRE